MPSDLSTWLIAVPQNGDSDGLLQELNTKFTSAKSLPASNIADLQVPALKTGTLDLLVGLSEELPKQDNIFTTAIAKVVDTLRNLVNNDPARLAQHTLVDERPVDDYLLRGWKWNSSKYGTQRGLRDIVDTLVKEMTSIDNVMKNRLNSYNLAKGSLQQLQRKNAGNLSTKSLVGIISKEHVTESEYLETIFVAVSVNNITDWNTKYERLAPMVVPRSSIKITQDDDFVLFGVVVFRKTRDQFTQKCRELRFVVRDFAFADDAVEKHVQEMESAQTNEKELWTEMLRVSRTNFSEGYKVLVHLKVVRLFVESVLRYGLPANYTGIVVKPESKTTKRILSTLTTHFAYLAPKAKRDLKKGEDKDSGEIAGEYQVLMEQEFLDFVLFEVPWIV